MAAAIWPVVASWPTGRMVDMTIDSTPPELIFLEEITQRIPYSQNHLRRLEATGDFPERVRLGGNRVAWVRKEVDDWLMKRINARRDGYLDRAGG